MWDGASRTYPLPAFGSLVLGRHDSCDVVIPHASVSRQHARLTLTSDAVSIADLGSANGTTVGGRALGDGAVVVPPGAAVGLGAAIVLVDGHQETRPPDAASLADAEGLVVLPASALAAVVDLLDRVAPSPLSVLIRGETGVGKELLAQRLHARSDRAGKPFIRLNCAALPAALLESELFGHEKGAFTGADHARPGLLEAAHGGTLFLDEIGDLAFDLQGKLLRVLESGELWRVGARTAKQVNVRFVAATNQPLEEWIARGRFRQDLFFRLAGVILSVPPLRERPNEIRPLAEHLLQMFAHKMKRPLPRVDETAWPALLSHPFAGNVRELRNIIERASLIAQGPTITVANLFPLDAGAQTLPINNGGNGSLQVELAREEAKRIEAALEQAQGNQTLAAKILGVSRRTLLRRLSDYQFARPRKRDLD